ncbi:MAG: DUF1080 domain-containing protein [Gemmataceae bacterium]|nr:DUF1080 domain-containing protein [Gemmataceae bacterium]
MRRILPLLALCLVAADAPNPAVDGKSLDGWDYLSEYWKAENGVITGSHDGSLKSNTFLCSKRTYKDFEMVCQVKLTGTNANSGVQIRSKVLDKSKWSVAGPQCDMGAVYWGSLYGEQFGGMMKQCDFAKVKPTLKTDDFNDYSIRVAGKKVTIKVNGITTVDGEFEKLPEEGIIALQIHAGKKMSAEFRNVVIHEIKGK